MVLAKAGTAQVVAGLSEVFWCDAFWGGVMLVRILQFIVGAALAGGGGYLAWLNLDRFGSIFPPGPAGTPWLLIAGLLSLAAGIVFLVSAVHPRPNRRKALAARAQARDEHLGEADAYYAEAGRAADRDWRSGDIPPPVVPQPAAKPQPAPPPVSEPAPVAPAPAPLATPAPTSPPPAPAEPTPAPAPVKAVAASTPAPPAPQPIVEAPVAARDASFPSAATLAPIPLAAEIPPAPVVKPAATPAPESVKAADSDPHAHIRAAIKAGRLDEAERLLDAGRDSAQGLVLADLTGLAGDHAAASGRQSHAKWLWRLAIKRFAEAGALETPGAKAVAESLRTGG